jgi:glycosyltransferase involved in cell wall biosynthesis
MPAGVRDPARPSGGNAYDVRVCAGLAHRGRPVREHEVRGAWPRPDPADLARLVAVVRSVPDGDLLLVDGLVGSTAPEVVQGAAERLSVAVLVHMPLGHGPSAPEVAERERRVLVAADVVVVTSEWTRDWLVDAYGLDPRRVRVATPGADLAPLSSLSTAGGRLLTVGPVSRAKGHDTLAAALGQLEDLDWRFVGAGSLTIDPDIAADVERWAVGRRARLTGSLVGPHLDAAYASTDLLVHPSRAETYGMVVSEALARGIPVVATDVGGTREALGTTERFGRPGLLVAPDDAGALAAALRRWLTDDALRRHLRGAAVARREELPTWDATVSVIDDALSSASLAGAMS